MTGSRVVGFEFRAGWFLLSFAARFLAQRLVTSSREEKANEVEEEVDGPRGYAAERKLREEVTPSTASKAEGRDVNIDADETHTANMWTAMLVCTAAVVLLPSPRAVSFTHISILHLVHDFSFIR